MPSSNHHAQKQRAAQLHEYDAQAHLAAALGVTEPYPHSLICFADVNESFSENFDGINTDGGSNPHTHAQISVGQGIKIGHSRGGHVIFYANGIVIGGRVRT